MSQDAGKGIIQLDKSTGFAAVAYFNMGAGPIGAGGSWIEQVLRPPTANHVEMRIHPVTSLAARIRRTAHH